MKGLRHFVVHEYNSVDSKVVWDVIRNKLPELKRQLEAIDLPEE